ncbi:enoyl-CoA hydratase [Bacteriovorax stolpii]|uniref:Enoyl-CoA hydratase n=1 Tax=Bacteriovorax stolpii TaxID=960 RepID=A0A2K9NUX0_BACTC|nr:enoyl-CoA hydratase-related protein [Bacteriovorax stolpii]AUN99326.1 enoyl-CoA hydratase [Bacteriovorax stolpii]TDP55134.1 short chain enoyl-CoA hydratase [Bacteriovorax stolpii]
MNTNKSYTTLKFELQEKFGVITINRPTKLNALNTEVLSELKELLTDLKSDDKFEMLGLILTGEGEKAFIAGADIAEMADMTPSDAYTLGQLGQQVTVLFETIQVPVIACVNGFALGGGCEMAMSCDFIYATENAVFGQPEVKLGLIPGFGGTQRLAKLVGRNNAKELIFSGRNVKADEALRMGLVVRTFATKDAMMAEAMKTLKSIAANSPFAVGIAKKVMNEGIDLTIAEGLQLEKRQFSGIFSSEDMHEGTKAFVEKRAPNFKGK